MKVWERVKGAGKASVSTVLSCVSWGKRTSKRNGLGWSGNKEGMIFAGKTSAGGYIIQWTTP